jgi:hypothetical protein
MLENNLEEFLKMDLVNMVSTPISKIKKKQEKEMMKVNTIQQTIRQFKEKNILLESELNDILKEIQTNKNMMAKIKKQKMNQKGKGHLNPVKVNRATYSKNRMNLENVLEKKTIQFSYGKSKNRDNRNELDQLRREKMMRQKIIDGLEEEIFNLQEEVSEMAEEVEMMNEIHDDQKILLQKQLRNNKDKDSIGIFGLKEVAERLYEENKKSRQNFFEAMNRKNNLDCSSLEPPQIVISPAKKESTTEKQQYDEAVTLQERKQVTKKIDNLNLLIKQLLASTNTTSLKGLRDYIQEISETNSVTTNHLVSLQPNQVHDRRTRNPQRGETDHGETI